MSQSHGKQKFFARVQTWLAALAVGTAALAAVPQPAAAANGDGINHLLGSLGPATLDPYDNVESFDKTFTIDGRKRHVTYMKPIAASATPAPAILLLHYRTGNGIEMANLVQIGKIVRDFGVWAILPDGINSNWQKNPAQSSSIDDVKFLETVTKDATANYPLDAKRVYIAGYSIGGFMTLRMACEHSELFAAGFVVAGALLKSVADECAPSTTLPVAFVNGTSDVNVNYKGSVGVLSAPETADFWSALNSCTQAGPIENLPDVMADGTTVNVDPYRKCVGPKPVDFYTIVKGGHTWPGYHPFKPTLGRVSYDIDGTIVMWEFFQQFSRK